jgi:hypothetical protein
VARFAEDYSLPGDEAWRMFRDGSGHWRKVMTDWYSETRRQRVRDLQFNDPELYDIHMTSAELDIERESRTGAFAKPESRRVEYDDPSVPEPGEHTSLYSSDDPCRNPYIK